MKGSGTSVTPVIAGVRSDIERLLQKFIEVQSVRFEHFAICFREAKFSLIFAGRTSENELREFNEKLLLTAVTYCFPPYSFHVSVGGLYLLYSLYYLQPKKFRMQIRITPEQVETLKVLVDQVSEQQHFDVCYVAQKLLRDQAFHIGAFPDEHNPLNYHRFDNKEDAEKAAETLRNSQTFINELTSDHIISQLDTLHEQYVILKKRLVKNDQLPDSMALVDTNPMDVVKNLVSECEDRLERRMGLKKTKRSVENERADDNSTSHLQERRKRIKSQAYQSTAVQARHRRHRQEVRAVPESENKSKTIRVTKVTPLDPLFKSPPAPKRRGRPRRPVVPDPDPVQQSDNQDTAELDDLPAIDDTL